MSTMAKAYCAIGFDIQIKDVRNKYIQLDDKLVLILAEMLNQGCIAEDQ